MEPHNYTTSYGHAYDQNKFKLAPSTQPPQASRPPSSVPNSPHSRRSPTPEALAQARQYQPSLQNSPNYHYNQNQGSCPTTYGQTPGYGGFVPHARNRVGETFGKCTKECYDIKKQSSK